MAITKQKKKEILTKLEKIVKESPAIAFVNFHGLSVAQATELRRKLRESGLGYTVAKKSLARRALEGLKLSGPMPALEGEFALAYGTDPVSPAREVYTFQKKFEKKVSLLGGVFEGKFVGKEEILSIALIPSREVLIAQFVNLVNSPIQGLVMVLGQVAKSKDPVTS